MRELVFGRVDFERIEQENGRENSGKWKLPHKGVANKDLHILAPECFHRRDRFLRKKGRQDECEKFFQTTALCAIAVLRQLPVGG